MNLAKPVVPSCHDSSDDHDQICPAAACLHAQLSRKRLLERSSQVIEEGMSDADTLAHLSSFHHDWTENCRWANHCKAGMRIAMISTLSAQADSARKTLTNLDSVMLYITLIP